MYRDIAPCSEQQKMQLLAFQRNVDRKWLQSFGLKWVQLLGLKNERCGLQ